MRVTEEFLRHAVAARAFRQAQRAAAPVTAVVVDVVGPWQDTGAAAIGDPDGVLLHVRVRPHGRAERHRFLDGELTEWVDRALAPFAPARP